ncbi:MAG: hypothetical protein HDS31_06505 [Bacteroides sp.]|nr:hypothetical protein [Bacteroides sp.]
MNISKIAVFIAVWVIAALIGYYQEWGLVIAGILALPLWLLWAFSSGNSRSSRSFSDYGREGRRRQNVRSWGCVTVIVGLTLLCWFPAAPWILNWVALGLGVIAVLAGFAMACRGWRKLMGIFALGVVVMCYGFVPRPQYRYVSHYRAYDYSPYGVKVIEAYNPDKNVELYGLADRYDVILQPEYVNFYLLDRHQPYLAVDNGKGLGVYDLERHEMVIPVNAECAKISITGDKRYEMVDSAGRPFAEIELPRTYSRDNKEHSLKLNRLDHEAPAPEELITPVAKKVVPKTTTRIYAERPITPAAQQETAEPEEPATTAAE